MPHTRGIRIQKFFLSEKSLDHTFSIKGLLVRLFFLFQISTSAPTEHTAVMLMLCVTTPGDPITVRANMDFVEME